MSKMSFEQQRIKHCQFSNLLRDTKSADLSSVINTLSGMRINPRMSDKRVFSDRLKLLNQITMQSKLPDVITPIPISGSRDEPEVPKLSEEQVIAYARAFGIMPRIGNRKSKLTELENKVAQEIKKSGREKEVDFHDLTVFSVSLAIECNKANDHDVPNQLTHLLEAGYPNDPDPLKIVGERCQYPGCKGKYVWRKLPTKREKPPPRAR